MTSLFRYTCILAVAALAFFSVASCTKSEFQGPTLVSDSVNYKRTFTINPGESVTLTAMFENPESLSFTWFIDGAETAASGPSFLFTTKESGSYIITEKISNNTATVLIDYYVLVRGPYDSGSFLFDNSSTEGTLTFINSDFSEVQEKAYATVNPGKTLGTKIVSVNIYQGKLYILSKSEGLIVANAITLKEITRIKEIPASANYFLPLNRAKALLSTDNGIYQVNLNPLTVGEKVPGIGGRVGMMVNGKSYIMALTLENGIVAIDPIKMIGYRALNVGRSGLAQDMSGNVWTSYLDTLYSVNSSLYVKKYLLPQGFRVTSSWNPWNEGSLCASTIENSLFYVSSKTDGMPSNKIVRVDLNTIDNNINDINKPILLSYFLELTGDRVFNGIGLRISPKNNITASTVSSTGGSPKVLIIRAGDGTLVKDIDVANSSSASMLFMNAQ